MNEPARRKVGVLAGSPTPPRFSPARSRVFATVAASSIGLTVALAFSLSPSTVVAATTDDGDGDPESAPPVVTPVATPAWVDDAPAPVDAAQLRNVEPRTRVYIDGAFAQSPDLSALPYIVGSGRNYRASIGGSLRLRRFQLDAELPAAQSTTLTLTQVPGGMPIPQDERQTALSIGDLRLGAQWTDALPIDALPMAAGVSLRVRSPTHTTRFQFHLVDGSIGVYGFPYYFHIEPTALLGGAIGDFSFIVNEGAIVLVGPDGNFGNLHIVVPTITFWDAHYAVAYRVIRVLTLSTELATTIQVNHVDGLDFQKLNDVRAVSIVPGLQVHVRENLRIDVAGRWGLTHGAELFGVIGYAGSRSVTLRLTWFL